MKFKPAAAWLLAAVVAVAGQAALLQSFSRFASEAASWRSSRLIDRRAETQARIEAARAVDLYSYNGYALFRLAAGDFAAAPDPAPNADSPDSLKRALEYMPHRPNVLALAGENLYRRGHFAESARAMDQLFRMRPKPEGNAAQLNLIRASAHFHADDQANAVVPITAAARYPANATALAIPRLLNATALDQPLSTEAAAGEVLFAGEHRRLDWKQVRKLFAAAQGGGRLPALIEPLRNALARSGESPSKLRIHLDLITGRRQDAAAMARGLQAAAPDDPEVPQILRETALGQPAAN